MFGLETSYYPPNPKTFMPNDAVRMDYIVRLVKAGYGKQVRVCCVCCALCVLCVPSVPLCVLCCSVYCSE